MRGRLTWAVMAVALAGASSASAAWLEARSKHFIVYANASEKTVTDFSTRLERLDAVLRHVHNIGDHDGIESNPVTVYVAPDTNAVQRLYGNGSRRGTFSIYGFYMPRVEGSVAFTPHAAGSGGQFDVTAEIVLYHEYAHHFLLGNFPEAYPRWFSEGYAEFASTTKFFPDHVQVGGAALHRAYGLVLGQPMPLETLFAADTTKLSGEQLEAVYGHGWLLTHYLLFNPDRLKQFQQYLKLLNSGTPSLDAARQAFGDLKKLDRELAVALNASRITVLNVANTQLPDPHVTVRPLSAGESALMMLRMQSERGVDAKTAPTVFHAAQPIAAAYPADANAQGWLAEMAYDAKDDDAAETAADKALAADPTSRQALLYKARVHLRRAEHGGDAKAWAEARSWIVKANHADPNSAEALMLYYQSFRDAKAEPSKSAIAGLQRAFELVPQDEGLRFAVARQDIVSGDIDEARMVLRPLAYDPHAPAGSPVTKLLADLDGGKGKAALDDFDAAIKKAETEDEK